MWPASWVSRHARVCVKLRFLGTKIVWRDEMFNYCYYCLLICTHIINNKQVAQKLFVTRDNMLHSEYHVNCRPPFIINAIIH
jgi:hypothetical protein